MGGMAFKNRLSIIELLNERRQLMDNRYFAVLSFRDKAGKSIQTI